MYNHANGASLTRREISMRAVIYCRVSTDDQEKEGTSLQTQREACLAYCKQKDYQVIRQFSETCSGLTLDRPELIKLRNLIRTNDIDVVIIYCLDRLSRNATHGVILRDELDKNNVSLESITEDIDKSPLGEAITYLRGTFAQIESEKIRERTMRGKLAHVNEGRLPQGTGIGIYGYQWDKTTKKRTIIEHEAEVVQKIFSMVLQGSSVNQIAIELNRHGIKTKTGSLWHSLTIRRILNNTAYTGKTYYGMTKRVGKHKVIVQPKENWILLPDITPPIIPDEMFERAYEAMKQAKLSRPIKPYSAYLLTGFLKCSECGSPLGGTTLNGKYRYYQCRGARPTETRGKICNARYIKADDLEKAVWNKVIEMLTSPLTLLSLLTEIKANSLKQPKDVNASQILEKQIRNLRRKVKAYPAKEKRLYSLLSHDAITKDYVLDEVNRLKLERQNDNNLLKELLANRKKFDSNKHLNVTLNELSESIRAQALLSQQASPELC